MTKNVRRNLDDTGVGTGVGTVKGLWHATFLPDEASSTIHAVQLTKSGEVPARLGMIVEMSTRVFPTREAPLQT